MYETSAVGGNKFEAAFALRSLKKIMGQITSNHAGSQQTAVQRSSSSSAHPKNGKVYHRYSSPPIAMRPFANEEDDLPQQVIGHHSHPHHNNNSHGGKGVIRDSKRIVVRTLSQKRQLEAADASEAMMMAGAARKVSNSGGAVTSSSVVRPVTVTDMNMYNLDKSKSEANAKAVLMKSGGGGKQEADNQLIMRTGGGGATNGGSGSVNGELCDNKSQTSGKSSSTIAKNRDVFAVEGYHKTDHCYYKRPDGGYLKLPPDSFHKMSEGCYVKRGDGTFVRIDSAAAIGHSQSSTTSGHANDASTAATPANRPKSNVLRFLKRSKSHTPSTMKELQREKERGEKLQHRLAVAERNAARDAAAAAPAGAQNRRVMVTMIDGGLPVVATSKADRVHKPKNAHLHVAKHQAGKGKDIRSKVN